MKRIHLNQGFETCVDDGDFEGLNQKRWRVVFSHNRPYARHSWKENGRTKSVYMHREILNLPEGQEADHIDGNGLNNQRSNLRLCTRQQNQCNRKISANNKTGFKGVYCVKQSKGYRATIQVFRKSMYLGTFLTAAIAAEAYDRAAIKNFGEFALTNRQLGLLPSNL